MKFSVFPSAGAKAGDEKPHPVDMTWEQFVANLGPHRFDYHQDAKKKKALPMFSPAHYPEGTAARGKDHVLTLAFGVLDLDDVTPGQLLDVLRRVDGYNAVLYSTWSHADNVNASGLWRVRICVEFSRPVTNQEWKTVWSKFVNHFNAPTDPSCKDSGRAYYGAFAPPGTERDAEWAVFAGRPLDVDALRTSASPGAPPPVPGTDKVARGRLERLAVRWRRSRDEWRATMGEALTLVCKGEPFADNGTVDTTIFQLCRDLAAAFPNAIPMSIAEHFVPSLSLMAFAGKDPHTAEDVAAKIARAQEEFLAEQAATLEAEATEKRLRMRQAFAHVDPTRDHAYTEAELEAFAAKLGCSREEMQNRWIIQRGNLFYILGPGAKYSDPYSERDVSNAVLRDLAPAISAGVELWGQGTSGEPYRKPLGALMGEYGTVATNYILDLRAQEATYEPGPRLFTVAPAPIRPLTPTHDPEVATWIQLLCGECTADVNNWLALATDLDSTCAALMLTGPGDTGKSLFAHGVSRLWSTQGPTKLSSAMAGFNAVMTQNPLVFGDEQLPKDFRGFGRTPELREFIAARSRPYNRKFADETVLIGAIRLVIAANNEDILAIGENLTVNDINAIGDRFYHVKVSPDAITYLAILGEDHVRTFVTQDRIAKHALWLRDNYPIRRDGRFMIRPRDRNFYRALTTKSGIRSAVCQWLVGFVREPRRVDMKNHDPENAYRVFIRDGALFVQTKGILDSWDLYVKNEMVPQTGKLAQAITGLSVGDREHLVKPGGGQAFYRRIEIEHLIAWAKETEFATEEEIRSALRVNTPTHTARPAGDARPN